MKTLTRYVVSRIAARALILLGVFLAVLVGGQLGLFIGRGVPPQALFPIVGTLLILSLPVALPMSVATAVLVILGGMTRDGEMQALAAAGVDPRRTALRAWPVIVGAMLTALLLVHVAWPMAIGDLRANQGRLAQTLIAAKVAAMEPIWDEQGTMAWAAHVDGKKLRDVVIRIRKEGDDTVLYAPRARWVLATEGVEFRLDGVRLIQRSADGGLRTGEAVQWSTLQGGQGLLETEPDSMTTPAVLAALALGPGTTKNDRARFNNSRLTLHLRLYLPIAVASFALFAAGLALVLGTAESLVAVGLVIVVAAISSYPAIGYVKNGPGRPQMDPGLLLWTPTLLLAVGGWMMLSSPARIREWLAAPTAWLRRRKAP